MKKQLSPAMWQVLSTYLDGQLSDREKARLEARLANDAALQEALDSLRQTRLVLRHAAHRRAPRNFTLTPAMAEQIKPQRGSSPVVVRGLRLASLASTFLLLLTLAGQLIGRLPLGASAPMIAAQEMSVEKMVVPEAEAGTPIIITWGTPTPFGYGGVPMGMGGGGESVDVLPPVDGIGGGPGVTIKGGEPAPGITPPDERSMLPEATPAPVQEVLPPTPLPEGMEPQPTEEAAFAAPAAEANDAAAQPGGPILGLQVDTAAFDAQNAVRKSQSEQPLSPLAIASIVLAALAVLTGAAAIYLKRRG